MKEYCETDVWSEYRAYRCSAKAKVERDGKSYCGRHDPVAKAERDGKFYCGTHDPVAKAEREKKRYIE